MLTVREIKDLLKQERISISKRRGQNFLIDAQLENKIIAAINIEPADEILEIGPGLGALTEDLARQASKVIAVEKDRALAEILRQKQLKYKNLQIVHQDILKFDIEKHTQEKIKVVGNLPYYITTPIIAYLLEEKRAQIKDIFITVQYELGKRLSAKKPGKDYSALSVFVQYFTRPQVLFSLPKRAFYPQPEVDSVFVHLQVLDRPSVKVNNQKQFFKIVRACFNQRRKTILNSLAHNLANTEKNRLQQALQDGGIDVRARPQELSLDEFALIEDTFYKRRLRIG